MTDNIDPYEEDYQEQIYSEEDDFSDDPCASCGPHCSYWLGDNLCELALEQQQKDEEDYMKNHMHETSCPICQKRLKEYEIKGGSIFSWNAGFYNPMLALEILGPIWLNKTVLHSDKNIYHIIIEWGTGPEEKIIRLI